jgi:hypothetical protein
MGVCQVDTPLPRKIHDYFSTEQVDQQTATNKHTTPEDTPNNIPNNIVSLAMHYPILIS